MESEANAQKTIERVVSQRALQMGSSFPCQICVVGFLCGICLTCFFVAGLTSFGSVELGGLSFSPPTAEMSPQNSSEGTSYIGKSVDRQSTVKETERRMNSQRNYELTDGRVSLLYSTWSSLLKESIEKESVFLHKLGASESDVPEAPHLENCKLITDIRERLDTRSENGTNPPWKTWKGSLGLELLHQISADDKQEQHVEYQAKPEGAYPPWIVGSNEDNYPLTRRAQHNLWIHQHPLNCSGPHVRFLVSDWETMPGYGIGAQLAGMCGLLAIAVKEKRVLVTNYFNRADHDGCKGGESMTLLARIYIFLCLLARSLIKTRENIKKGNISMVTASSTGPLRSRWSCYFFPETSTECQNHAFELMKKPEAWGDGILTGKDNYTSKEIWSGRTPRVWGEPWNDLQPTTEINGSLIRSHRKMDRRWWRAQAVRYLMRYQTKYTCDLLNIARHTAFGMQAAKVVAESLGEWQRVIMDKPKSDMEQFVWSSHKPWILRPMLSMHVRMGDKAYEMKVVGFEDYMRLARRIRKRFPDLNNIWLSTEMQEVIDKTRLYPNWNFYYTNVSRQVGNITMASYEASLGRETSTNYPLVNFLMATEADFFVGALGSTWCFFIDGMRNTGGKVMAGYLSVNKDRFW